MSDQPLGRYHFLAWARRGIGASIANPDGGGALPSRATLDVQLNVTAQQGGTSVAGQPRPDVKISLFGPGDILGLELRHIIRTEPRAGTPNYGPNYLCGIEFDHPDFPGSS